ncbi:hypothetical protein [uncultured Desulfovibrio sp.]|uniref:hypothetical protein n=1 Tax=uncultured Desulfovibrio sp. TaxID=167968 RepID=UPI00261B20B2|nr:hypothetical protein [uncultured Desulfovibrio sp.]
MGHLLDLKALDEKKPRPVETKGQAFVLNFTIFFQFRKKSWKYSVFSEMDKMSVLKTEARQRLFAPVIRYAARECDERNNPACHAGEEGLLSAGRGRFAIGKRQNARCVHSAARPEVDGKTVFFSIKRQAIRFETRSASNGDRFTYPTSGAVSRSRGTTSVMGGAPLQAMRLAQSHKELL